MMKRAWWIGLGAWLGWVLAAQGAARTVEVYPAGSSDLGVFAAAVRGVAGPEDVVIPDPAQHRVVVIASPETHRAIAALGRTLQRPPRNVRIDVSIRDRGTEEGTAFGVGGEGAVVVRGGDVSTRVRLQPRLASTRTEAVSGARQSLVVSSGKEAVLRVGESVPYPDLGGLTADNEFYSRFLVGADRSRSARRLEIRLTPTILDAGGAPVVP